MADLRLHAILFTFMLAPSPGLVIYWLGTTFSRHPHYFIMKLPAPSDLFGYIMARFTQAHPRTTRRRKASRLSLVEATKALRGRVLFLSGGIPCPTLHPPFFQVPLPARGRDCGSRTSTFPSVPSPLWGGTGVAVGGGVDHSLPHRPAR